MTAISSTSSRLHSEFVRLLFLQANRETDRFFAASGVQSAQFNSGQFKTYYQAFFWVLIDLIVELLGLIIKPFDNQTES